MSKRDQLAESDFCRRLEPVGRILEMPGWFVWGCSPVFGADGRIHVFFARWPESSGHPGNPMGGWLTHSEIAHAAADAPEGPYEVLGTVLSGRGGSFWDGVTIHNPNAQWVDGKLALFYMGNSAPPAGGSLLRYVERKRVGLALAASENGPFRRVGDGPLLDVPADPLTWDSVCTTNPSFVRHPDGRYWLYYKGWDYASWRRQHGNRKYGLAVADQLEGPYRKHPGNPLLDFSSRGNNAQVEDAYVFLENGQFCMLIRDMGVHSHTGGLILRSEDGIHWGDPEVGFFGAARYFSETPTGLSREGQLERPQLLMCDGRPTHLFCALRGGRYGTSSPVVFRIRPD